MKRLCISILISLVIALTGAQLAFAHEGELDGGEANHEASHETECNHGAQIERTSLVKKPTYAEKGTEAVWIECVNCGQHVGATTYSSVARNSMPEVRSLKVTNTTKGPKLTWKKISGVTGYKVYRKASGSFKLVKSLAGATCVKWTDRKSKVAMAKRTYYVVAYATSKAGTTFKGPKSEKVVNRYIPKAYFKSLSSSDRVVLVERKIAKKGINSFQIKAGTRTYFVRGWRNGDVSGYYWGKFTRGKTYSFKIRNAYYDWSTSDTFYGPWSCSKKHKVC